jgi:chromate reductase
MSRTVAVLVGSLRKASLSRKIANALVELAPEGLELKIVEIGDLPLYNEDAEAEGPPAAWTRFRDEVRAADGVIFVTPEYNRGVPGALKNAIDVGSRPYGSSVYGGKPAAVISQSPGALGGFGANHGVRQSLVFLDMPVLQQPEAYLNHTGAYFDEAGKLVKDDTRQLLQKILDAYAALLEKHAK